MKINHWKRERGMEYLPPVFNVEDMTPKRLNLYVGQSFYIIRKEKDGNQKRKLMKIIKLYRHHALCQVNGRWNESITYAELAGMIRREEILNE